jgi:hypothetical protein
VAETPPFFLFGETSTRFGKKTAVSMSACIVPLMTFPPSRPDINGQPTLGASAPKVLLVIRSDRSASERGAHLAAYASP